MSLRIAIIGAGPGGATLARLLQSNDVPCTVFDLDNPAISRSQGGSFDLHPESGQLALKEAGLFGEFTKYMRLEGSALRFVEPAGSILLDTKGEGLHAETRPEIDRRELRDILINSLKPGTLHWEKKLIDVESKPNGKFNLHFADGKMEEEYDLVIGADGAWSRVRKLLTEDKPFYSGIFCVETRIEDVNSRFPKTGEMIGPGGCFYIGEGKTLMAQRNGDRSARIYAMLRVPEDWGVSSGNQLGPSDDPFRRSCVNVAMTDALDLSKTIISAACNEISLLAAIEQYEITMYERSTKSAQLTLDNLNLIFSGETPQNIANKFKAIMLGDD
ncbi:hypothetical protein Clacol_003128 [Clathrus columnatus]|uniref:FAD-binding domain-containing protein n=1 Tax=Clathrus columnatus TaxID=1419009 RepID=A0AAV5A8C4_9AGAM|nr:hypothetical protein Clacol_003128 [Clathrus columnatus]